MVYTQPACQYSSDSDTDDTQYLGDHAITNPFTDKEMVLISDRYKSTHNMFQKACEQSFGNAWGKFFMTELLKLVRILNEDLEVYHTTSSSGSSQPGMPMIQCELLRRDTRSRNSQEEPTVMHTFNRYPDFTAQEGSTFHIVGEIKSEDSAGIDQNLEKMIGLFQPNQTIMLCLAIWPDKIQPQILYKTKGALELHKLNEIAWKDETLWNNYTISVLYLQYY